MVIGIEGIERARRTAQRINEQNVGQTPRNKTKRITRNG